MARTPAKPPARGAKPAARPVRASPAATAGETFYSPREAVEPRGPMAQAAERPSELEDFNAEVALEADHIDDVLSLDPAVAAAALRLPDDERAALAAEIARIRQFRKPLGSYNLKLELPKRRGYHRHWFNDVAGRIDAAKANGWSHLKDTEGKALRRNVGRSPEGGVLHAFAMEIPEVFWMEDLAAKHKVAQDRMDSLTAEPFQAPKGVAKKEDAGKFYSPKESPIEAH